MPEKGASTSAQLGQPPVKKPTLGVTRATDALNLFAKDKIGSVSTCQFCKLTYSSTSTTRALKHLAGRGKGIAPYVHAECPGHEHSPAVPDGTGRDVREEGDRRRVCGSP
eukprot:364074-Chlamydomonas_euryale.AAC.1